MVKYKEKMGSDFDHKMVIIKMGSKGKPNQKTIFHSTLQHTISFHTGIISIYDSLNNHLVERNEHLAHCLGRALVKIREFQETEK
jgi:hypothetical protein